MPVAEIVNWTTEIRKLKIIRSIAVVTLTAVVRNPSIISRRYDTNYAKN